MRDPCRYYLLQRAATTYLFEAEHGLRYGVESCAACPEHCVLCSRPCAARGSKRNVCRLWVISRVGAEITVLSWARGDVNHKNSYLIGYAGLNCVLESG